MIKTRTVEGFVIREVQVNRGEAKITLAKVKDQPGMVAKIFSHLSEKEVNVNLIVQNSRPDGTAHVTFTMPRTQVEVARETCEEIREEVGATEVEADPHIATISVIGIGMRSHTDVAGRMFASLAKAGVNIDLISTSEIKIGCVVAAEQADCAYQALMDEFKADLEE